MNDLIRVFEDVTFFVADDFFAQKSILLKSNYFLALMMDASHFEIILHPRFSNFIEVEFIF